MSGYVELTGDNFDVEVMESSIPVLVDFWAEWCGPCKMIGPFIDQLAAEYEGRIKIGKVNVDKEQDLASQHGISSIPMLMVYQNGNIVNQRAGAMPKPDIEKLFRDFI